MKSVLLCIVLSVIIASLIVIPHVFISETTHEIRELLKEADNSLEREDWKKAAEYCSVAKKKWNKYSFWYEMITEHSEIDDIVTSLRQVERFTKEQEIPEARALLAELDFLVSHLKDTDSLSMKNIF